MPTNLPPEYFDVDKRFRAARTAAEKIACLEEMLAVVPKHKGTDKLRADLRRRMSRLKTAVQTKKGASRQASAYRIVREGAAQAAIIGTANVGKSSLLRALTNATPEVSEFPYTTWNPAPGMLLVDGIPIQLIDTAPLTADFVEPELLDLLRRMDLILVMVDLSTSPLVQFETVIPLLAGNRILAGDPEPQPAAGQETGVPVLILANKNDGEKHRETLAIFRELIDDRWEVLDISVRTGHHLETLRQRLVERLQLIRVFAKSPGKKPDLTVPFVLRRGSTVADFAEKVHRDFTRGLRTARLWGASLFDGQMVSRDHVLEDGDVVELLI